MNFAASIQRLLNKNGIGTNLGENAIVVVGIIALDLVIILFGSVFADSIPFIAVALSWIWFLLPGLLLSFALADHVSWWERIPISFVLTIGLATPITIIAILLHVDLNQYILLHTGILLISAFILILYRQKIRPTQENVSSTIPRISLEILREKIIPLTIAFVLVVGILAFLSYQWPLFGDDVAGLSIFAEVIQLNHITGTEPFHGTGVPVTPRNELIAWTYMAILTNKISGTTPAEFVTNSRPILVAMAMLSLATLLIQLFKNRYQALFLLIFWSLYLLATTQADGIGRDLITRIFQDKFLGWFVVIPIVFVFFLWFVESGDWSKLIGFGILTFGASMVHPVTLIQTIILIGGFGVVHLLFDRSRKTLTNLFLVILILLLCTAIPFVQYLRFNSYSPIELAGLGDAVEFGRLSSAVGRYRLWLLGAGRYILHPSVIIQPIIIAAYILLPLIIYQARKHYAARLIVGTLFILPVLLYIPTFAALAGKVVTPYLIWRLAWPLPLFAVLTIGWIIWWLAQILGNRLEVNGNRQWISNIIYPSLIILVLIFAAPKIRLGLKDYYEQRAEINLSTCVTAKNVLSYLNEISQMRSVNVLASHNLNFCIPGFAAMANVVEFRGYGTVNRLSEDNLLESIQRVEDVNYFNVARYLDDRMLEVLLRHDIDYVMIEKEKLDLNLQFRYSPAYFQNVYEDADYSLYKILKPLHPSKIVEANTNLRLNQFEVALQNFSRILQKEPTNVLAHLGAGLAQEGLGKSELAIASYQKAIRYAPDEAALHAQLASSYMEKDDLDNAIKEYQIAANLSPERYSLFTRLGQMYTFADQVQEAKASFEKAASLQATKETAAYYSVLGRLFQSMNLFSEAIEYHEKAISINADAKNYIDLARAFTLSGRIGEAIKAYKMASDLDRWSYLPHLDLGYLYWRQSRVDEAIKEFEIARQLNPTNVSAYILLGKAVQEESGLDAAIEQLEEFKVNSVLPGPYTGIATLMVANRKFEDALKELSFSANIQPESAAIQTAKGIIAMADRQTETAYESFSKALLYNPDLISARLGLSLLYRSEAKFDLEIDQLQQIVRLAPMATWSHLNLAQAYIRRGDWKLAQKEIDRVIKLEPNSIEGYIAKGNLHKAQLNFNLAISDYSKALEFDSGNLKALIGLGDIYQNSANINEAERTYSLAAKLNEDSVYPKIKLADIYWQQGRFEEATALAETAVKIAPDSDFGLSKLAEIYRMQGRNEEAKTLYERVIQTEPSVLVAYSALAQLMEDEDNDQSLLLSWYDNLLNANPGSAEAYLAAGQYFIDQGQLDQAEQILKTALAFPDVSVENYLALSSLQQKRGEWGNALSTLQTASHAFPGKAIAFNNLASFYLKNGNISEAEIYFNKAIDLDPGFVSAYIGKSQIEQIKGNFSQAEKVLQNVITINPGSPQVYLAMSSFQESIGRIDLAEENLKNAIAIKPSDIEIHQALGQFYLRQNRYDEAFDILQNALLLPGSKLEIYLDIGNLLFVEKQIEEATEWYQNASLMNRSDVRPYLALANLYQSIKKWDRALENLNVALNIAPASIETNLAMGEFCQRLARLDDANNYFERANSFDRSQIDSLIAMAEILSSKGNWDQAITNLEQAIVTSPTSLPAYTALAQTYQISGNYSQAETIITQGVQNAIDKQNAYLSRAAFYENHGKWYLAQADYEKAWSLTPYSKSLGLKLVGFHLSRNNHEQALGALSQLENRVGSDAEIKIEYGNIYSSQAKWAEAIEAFKQAIDLDSSARDAYIGLARIYELQGDVQGSINLYQIALQIIPNEPSILIKLGEALRSQGKYREAQTVYQNLLDLDPTNYTALMNLEQLNKITQKPELDLLAYVQNTLLMPSPEAFITIAQQYQSRGEWNLAHSWFQRAVNLEPYDSENWFYLGNYYRALTLWDKALEAYDQGLKYQPTSFDLFLARGSVQEELGLSDAAQDSYQRAIEINPRNIEGYIALSKLHFKQEKIEQSLSTINEGIVQVPGDYRGYQTLGEIYVDIDPENTLRAEEVYQTGLDVLPGTPELYALIGELYTNRLLAAKEKQEYKQADSDFETAMTNFKNALNLEPNNELSLIGMGKLMLTQGSKDEAVTYFEKAVNANPHSSLSLTCLGDVYLDLGRIVEAVDIYNQILAYEPGNPSAHVGLSNAYHDLPALNISQAAASVELRVFDLASLVEHIRRIAIRETR